MRVDAQRNRRRLLDATTELILEVGGAPARDAVAQRAGVGIATLYRHFPDQQSLLRAVALDVLDRTIEEGRAAIEGSATGGEALRRYLHAAIDTGLGAVNVIHALLESTDWPDRLAAAQDVLGRLVEAARRDRAIGDDVDAGEIALATIRFCRPLAMGLERDEERAIARRQVDCYLDGLAARAAA